MTFNLLHLYQLDASKKEAVRTQLLPSVINTYFDLKEISPEEVHFLCVGAHELNTQQLKQFPQLKFIQIIGRNTTLIDLDYCKTHTIGIGKTTFPRGYIIAEHAIALALSFTRNIALADKSTRNHSLKNTEQSKPATEVIGQDNWCQIPSSTLYGKSVGIIGFGAIGLELNKRLQAFDCQVSYHKRTQFSPYAEYCLNVTYKSLKDILKSDIVFIHLGLTKTTKNLLNYELLQSLKNDAIVINCGRACVINEADLLRIISEKPQLKLGMDVFWEEPLSKDHPITSIKNTLLTPHMAECGGEDISLQRQEAYKNIVQFRQELL